jgi:hypothetical protein
VTKWKIKDTAKYVSKHYVEQLWLHKNGLTLGKFVVAESEGPTRLKPNIAVRRRPSPVPSASHYHSPSKFYLNVFL